MYDPLPLRVYLHPLFRVMAGFLRNPLPRISINAPPPPFDSPRYIGNLFLQFGKGWLVRCLKGVRIKVEDIRVF